MKAGCFCESAVNFHQATFCRPSRHLFLNLPFSSLITSLSRLQAVISNVTMSMKLSFQFCPLGCLFKTAETCCNIIYSMLLHSCDFLACIPQLSFMYPSIAVMYSLKVFIIISTLSNDRSKASSKTIPPHSAI